MQIQRSARAGTLESSDVLVEMIPGDQPMELEIHSPVMSRYGEAIRQSALEFLHRAGVTKGLVRLEDRGALDCTLNARLEACLERAQTSDNERSGECAEA